MRAPLALLAAAGLLACGRYVSPEECYAMTTRDLCEFAPAMRTADGREGQCRWVSGRRFLATNEGSLSCTVGNRGVCSAVLPVDEAACPSPEYCASASPRLFTYPDGNRTLAFEMECGWEVVGALSAQCGDGSEQDDLACACACLASEG